MGYPTAVGVMWNIADRFAVRPEVTIAGTTADSSGSQMSGVAPTATNDSFSIGAGLSALFYLTRWDALRTYVSPRFVYSHSSQTASSGSSTVSISTSSEGSTRSYTSSGSFGAEYAFGRRFGAFGELGLSYASTTASTTSTLVSTITTGGIFGIPVTTTTTTSTARSDSHSKAWGVRSAVGVIFYF
jgi:hypothetical protein